MSERLIDDALWRRIEPLLPKPPRRRWKAMGRPRIPDRAALTGILFVLRSGIPWQMLPKEMGCGSGSTCWRRLVRWQRARVWRRLRCRLDAVILEDRFDRVAGDVVAKTVKPTADARVAPGWVVLCHADHQ